MTRRLIFEVVLAVGSHIVPRQVPGIGREGSSVIFGIVRVSYSSLFGLGIFYLHVDIVQGYCFFVFFLNIRYSSSCR